MGAIRYGTRDNKLARIWERIFGIANLFSKVAGVGEAQLPKIFIAP